MNILRKVLLAAGCIVQLSASAKTTQDTTTTDTNHKAKPVQPSPVVKNEVNLNSNPKVIGIYNPKFLKDTGRVGAASMGDIIAIRVENMGDMIKISQCEGKIPGCSRQQISLFINGRKINNISPLSGAPRRIDSSNVWELEYQLERNTINDKIWATILGAPSFFDARFFKEAVVVSVGLENAFAIEADTNGKDYNFQIERIHKAWFWVCVGAIILYFLLLFTTIQKSGLLRDRSIDLSALGPLVNNQNRVAPFSLARLQMTFWFSLVVISFMFIWLITDAYDIITPTVLALIGISTGTSLGAMVIDNNKKRELLAKTLVLQESLNQPALTTLEIQKISSELNRNISELTPSSGGFIHDILDDVNGMSFHRVQMLVWTLVLGIIFVYSVWKKLSMPDFNTTLLALQGITAGTYLGFKFPENQT